MTRDHLLFLIIGLLAGFTGGYLAHEFMAARQPPPLWAGAAGPGAAAAMQQQAAGAAGGANTGAAPQGAGSQGTAGQAAGAQAAMADVQRLRQHVEENPGDYDSVRRLANLNYDIANWSRAAELYRRYLEGRPGDPDVLTDLGACLRNLGEHQEALVAFRQARETAPEHWQSLFNEILTVAFDLGDPGATTELLARLENLQPENPDVARLATEVRRRQGAS
ncbi:MAG: tetratricopeptide repeat protein [Holophagales bacterium]|nr:tetratricopeptide repeat protein [Holophagales bacterium]